MSILMVIESIEMFKEKGEYARAEAIARDALLEYADDYRLYEELTDIALYEGRLEDAEEMIRNALSLNPDSATGVYLAGYLAIMRRDFTRAIALMKDANEQFPNNAEIVRNLGWATFMNGEKEKGVAILRRAQNLLPEDISIAEDLALALISSGYEEEGVKLLQKFGSTDRLREIQSLGTPGEENV